MFLCVVTEIVTGASGQDFAKSRTSQYLPNSRLFTVAHLLKLYAICGIAGEELKMPRCKPSYNWVTFYCWMLFLRPCFLFYKELFIFPKLQIFRNVWAILWSPFNSSVARSLLRRPTSKQSAMRESWNMRLNSTASKCSSDNCTFCWRVVGDWRLGVHCAYKDVSFYFVCVC